jgi:hypothetical protein
MPAFAAEQVGHFDLQQATTAPAVARIRLGRKGKNLHGSQLVLQMHGMNFCWRESRCRL